MLSHSQIERIIFNTLDNPGWIVKVSSPLFRGIERTSIHKEDETEARWFYHYIKDGILYAVGDEMKLVRIASEIMAYFKMEQKFDSEIEGLNYLQEWYTFECDGFWEHLYGVSGEINAEGHCLMSIDLDETYWDEEPFETIGDVATFQCRKEGPKFIGEGKLEHVGIFLQTFKDWIESFDIVVLQTHEYKYYVPANELYGE
ncbi:immunity 53 family protein [Aerococcaceae bacterium NML210727]|nr:immunity 53 family protein [Aerococcaceae bacterium NML210727]MCW6654491.1 immunity 53 family protein [Aerococcaceae bacterium NML201296]MCW6675977.1 immunity 53 family protein [Aerococcaceae bacterium NML180378]